MDLRHDVVRGVRGDLAVRRDQVPLALAVDDRDHAGRVLDEGAKTLFVLLEVQNVVPRTPHVLANAELIERDRQQEAGDAGEPELGEGQRDQVGQHGQAHVVR